MNKDKLEATKKLVMDMREKIIKEYAYVTVKVDGLGTHGMKVLYFSACTSPESSAFGTGCGAFLYGDAVYRFHFDLKSNQMRAVEQVILRQDETSGPYIEHKVTDFGHRAFRDDTFMKDLDESEKALRRLMRSLESYVSRQGWPGYVKRNTALHKLEMDRMEAERGTKLVVNNSTYGITSERSRP